MFYQSLNCFWGVVPSNTSKNKRKSKEGLLYPRETNNSETVPSAGLGLVRSFAIGSDCSAGPHCSLAQSSGEGQSPEGSRAA